MLSMSPRTASGFKSAFDKAKTFVEDFKNNLSASVSTAITDSIKMGFDKAKKIASDSSAEMGESVNKGFKKLDFQVVIDKKYDEWHNNKMVSQLRPLTLFGDKFEMYLNQPVKEKTLADLTMDELNQLMESEESNIIEDENDTFTIC